MSNRYQAYPEYKDSCDPIIGSIPTNWHTKQVRYLLQDGADGIKIGPFGSALKLEDMVEFGTRVYGQENVIKKNFTIGKRRISQDKFKEMQVYQIFPDDLLVTMMGTSGKCELVPSDVEKGIIDSHLLRLRVKPDEILPRYFRLLIDECYEIENQIKISGKGSIMHGLNSSIVKSLTLPLPNVIEQKIILSFLDHETAKIDTLIEKQQQLIKLLKEKRQAVISHAVTKGLNPDVPMRDSGVEWLGEVPEHWKVLTVRNLIRAGILAIQDDNHGEQHPVAAEYVDEGIPFLMANNVQSGKVSSDDCKYISLDRAEKLRIGFAKPNDVLLTHKGTVGEVGLIPAEIDEPYWMLTPQVTYYRWKHQDYFNKYFYMLFQSVFFQEQLALIGGKQSTRAYVGLVAQGDVFLVVPPQSEQVEIFSKLDRSVSKYDHLIERANLTVKLLNERRTALISAAVTGKIDVRDWQAPDPSCSAIEEVLA